MNTDGHRFFIVAFRAAKVAFFNKADDVFSRLGLNSQISSGMDRQRISKEFIWFSNIKVVLNTAGKKEPQMNVNGRE